MSGKFNSWNEGEKNRKLLRTDQKIWTGERSNSFKEEATDQFIINISAFFTADVEVSRFASNITTTWFAVIQNIMNNTEAI